MSTRAANRSATTALVGSRVRMDIASTGTTANRLVGRSCTVTGTWYPTIATSAVVFADTKHRGRPEEDASQL